MRIAVGGFQHETNTFAPQKASFADFVAPDAWPGLTRGPALLDAIRGVNLPAAGFVEEARARGHEVQPLVWCSATPSAHVTRDAYERIVAMMLDELRAVPDVDAVYLDLHGAMVAEHIDDADGELLQRIRQQVGAFMPVVASLDFHANVSPLMVEQASALVAYRTYPHTDMSECGVRAMRVLDRLAVKGERSHACLKRLPFLIPLTSQCTLLDPLASLMAESSRLEHDAITTINFTPGFPAADVPDCGPAVFGYGDDPVQLAAAVDWLAAQVSLREAEFALEICSIDEALREIECTPPLVGRPIVLADTQDNPGGGGTADTTSLLKALIERTKHRVLAGIICDPAASSQAHATGVGAHVDLMLGGRSGPVGESPIARRFEVVALGDGRFTATGSFYQGARMNLGPMALLKTGEVYIAVASRKQQAADLAMFRHLGVCPQDFAIVVLKSSVHFRADFSVLANRILIVDAPGANIADPARLRFQKLPDGMRAGIRK